MPLLGNKPTGLYSPSFSLLGLRVVTITLVGFE
nr:MAG TPA: hypothetical protein [Crassvirales sp.]